MGRYVSYVVQSWQGDGSEPMRWQVRRVQGEEEMRFPDASFVVRAWVDDQEQVVRCIVHHVQSGREVQFQSGERAIEFIRAWMKTELPVTSNTEVLSDGPAL
ncbi:MAG: hypothetical protein JW934_07600 [Anaerolineae bacterium]|nr:hypothetical protein [Anaerolineae bacterium]